MNQHYVRYLSINAIILIMTLALLPVLQKAENLYWAISYTPDLLNSPSVHFLLKEIILITAALLLLRWLIKTAPPIAIIYSFIIVAVSYIVFEITFPRLPSAIGYYGDINRWIRVSWVSISELELLSLVTLFLLSWLIAKYRSRFTLKITLLFMGLFLIFLSLFFFDSEYRLRHIDRYFESIVKNYDLLSSKYFLLQLFITGLYLPIIWSFASHIKYIEKHFERYLLIGTTLIITFIAPMGLLLYGFGYMNNVAVPFNSFTHSSLLVLALLLGLGISILKQNSLPEEAPYSQRMVYFIIASFVTGTLTLTIFTTPLDLNPRGSIVDRNNRVLAETIIDDEYRRHYPYTKATAHIVGYTSPARIKKTVLGTTGLKEEYKPYLFFGKTGLEKIYESSLNGAKKIKTTIDIRLQEEIYKLFEDKSGVAIIMDITNGEVLSAVSFPSYDPSPFSINVTAKEFSKLIYDIKKPFYNRLINGLYPPSSLIKPLNALAMLEHNISALQKSTCNGDMALEKYIFKSHSQEFQYDVSMRDALAYDCDKYFYLNALKIGHEPMAKMYRQFALGSKTGIDLHNEFFGTVPDRKWKKEKYNKPWYTGETLNMSIGQGNLLHTPFQLVRMMGALGTGKLVSPHFVSSHTNKPIPVNVSADNLKVVQEGLSQAFSDEKGALSDFNLPYQKLFAGSMGQIQVTGVNEAIKDRISQAEAEELKKSHICVNAYYPKHKPKYVVMLLLEHIGANKGKVKNLYRKIIGLMVKYRYIGNSDIFTTQSQQKLLDKAYSLFKNGNLEKSLEYHKKMIKEWIPVKEYEYQPTRGDILSADGVVLATSENNYQISVPHNLLQQEDKVYFTKLVSLYSGISAQKLEKNFSKQSAVISYYANNKSIQKFQILSREIGRYGLLKKLHKNGKETYYGLAFANKFSINRKYPYINAFLPLLGYNASNGDGGLNGRKGLEKYFNDILNKGKDCHLSIPFSLQTSIESIADRAKEKYDAKEVLIGIMKSDDGKLLSLASSNRYNPQNIIKQDFKSIPIGAVEYLFEPGSTMIPIVLAQLLDTNKTQSDEIINGHNGHYKFQNKIIKDSKKFVEMKAIDSIINSSNIVIAQLAQRFSGDEYYKALTEFGLLKKSGIEISKEKPENSANTLQLNAAIHKATTSYGYGISTNIVKLLRAYNVFNNDGVLLQVSLLNDATSEKEQIITSNTASQMKEALQKNVERGTGVLAQVEGIEVGGKTATAHIAKNGKYTDNYNSSFFGFANNGANKYIIGVLVIKAKNEYYASKTAAPIFADVIKELMPKYKLFEESKKACALGDDYKCIDCGHYYYDGVVVTQNYFKAEKYFENACNKRYGSACLMLATMYSNALGVEYNEDKVIEYYSKACESGYAQGCKNYNILMGYYPLLL